MQAPTVSNSRSSRSPWPQATSWQKWSGSGGNWLAQEASVALWHQPWALGLVAWAQAVGVEVGLGQGVAGPAHGAHRWGAQVVGLGRTLAPARGRPPSVQAWDPQGQALQGRLGQAQGQQPLQLQLQPP